MTEEVIPQSRKKWLGKEENKVEKNNDTTKLIVFFCVWLVGGGMALMFSAGFFWFIPLAMGISLTDFKWGNLKGKWKDASGGRKSIYVTLALVLIPVLIILFSYLALMGMLFAIDLLIILPGLFIILYFVFRKKENFAGRVFGNKVLLVLSVIVLLVVIGTFASSQYALWKDSNTEAYKEMESLGSANANETGYLNVTLKDGTTETVNIRNTVTFYIEVIDIFTQAEPEFNADTTSWEVVKSNSTDNSSYDVVPKDLNSMGQPISWAKVTLLGDDINDPGVKSLSYTTDGSGIIAFKCYEGKYILQVECGGYSTFREEVIISQAVSGKQKQIFLIPMWYDFEIYYKIRRVEDSTLSQHHSVLSKYSTLQATNPERTTDEEFYIIFDEHYVRKNQQRTQMMWGWTHIPNLYMNDMAETQMMLYEYRGTNILWVIPVVGSAVGNAVAFGIAVVTVGTVLYGGTIAYGTLLWGLSGGYEDTYANYEYATLEVKASYNNHEVPITVEGDKRTTDSEHTWKVRVWAKDISGQDMEFWYRVEVVYTVDKTDVWDLNYFDDDGIILDGKSIGGVKPFLNLPTEPTAPDDEPVTDENYDNVNFNYVKFTVNNQGKWVALNE